MREVRKEAASFWLLAFGLRASAFRLSGSSQELRANGQKPNKKPIGCLLGACSGQHPMGYRFSLLTLLFSGVCILIKPPNLEKFRLVL